MASPITHRRGLYAIVDPEHCGGRDPLWVAERVLAGGCALLQLRDKRGEPAATRALAEALLARCGAAGVPFVLNDHVQLAAELGVAGLHLGQDDMPLAQARAALGAEVAIGLSTHSPAQAREAAAARADLIGFGPIFATRSKRDPDPVVGPAALAAVCRELAIPVVAIGGINADNVAEIARAGARLAAVIGAVCLAEDPALEARVLHEALLAG